MSESVEQAAPQLWVQPTTGMVHRTATCSVARRSRYGLSRLESYHVTQRWCKRCFPNGAPA